MKILIKNAQIVNENKIFKGDLLIEDDMIVKIGNNIPEEMLTELSMPKENTFCLASSMIRFISGNLG